MSIAAFDRETGAVVPPLTTDESLVCLGCGTVIPAADADADVGQTIREAGVPTCFECSGVAGFERVALADESRSVAQRWGAEVVAAGWTPIPSLLLRHARDLGLRSTDIVLIVALEDFRWEEVNDVVYPSRGKLAAIIGTGLSALDATVKRLECAGLIEVHTRHRSGGWQTSNGYSREGLANALVLLARSRTAGRDHAGALAELLAELRREGEQRRQVRLVAGHSESKDPEAEERNRDNQQTPSLSDETNLVHGSRNPKRLERRAA